MHFSFFTVQTLASIRENGFNKSPPSLANPTVLGRYAFELAGTSQKAVNNPDPLIRRYTPIKLAEGETLSLQVSKNEKIPDQQTLKADRENSIFLQHLLDNRDAYKAKLKESVPDQPNSSAFGASKKTKLLNADFVCLREVLSSLM